MRIGKAAASPCSLCSDLAELPAEKAPDGIGDGAPCGSGHDSLTRGGDGAIASRHDRPQPTCSRRQQQDGPRPKGSPWTGFAGSLSDVGGTDPVRPATGPGQRSPSQACATRCKWSTGSPGVRACCGEAPGGRRTATPPATIQPTINQREVPLQAVVVGPVQVVAPRGGWCVDSNL
jgi:hypothetical protein